MKKINEKTLTKLAREQTKSLQGKVEGVKDYVFNVTTFSCIFYSYTKVTNTFTGKSAKDSGFGFSLPGGLEFVANLTATSEQYNDELATPYQMQFVGGGEGVEGGVATAWDENLNTIGAGEWAGGGVSLGADAIVVTLKNWK